LRQQPLTAWALLGSPWCGCEQKYNYRFHGKIPFCDGTAIFWDRAVFNRKKVQSSANQRHKKHKRNPQEALQTPPSK
jgi:hypothetical protein